MAAKDVKFSVDARERMLRGKPPVGAIALSISSVSVAAPAPGHDLRRHPMTGLLTRAGKRGE